MVLFVHAREEFGILSRRYLSIELIKVKIHVGSTLMNAEVEARKIESPEKKVTSVSDRERPDPCEPERSSTSSLHLLNIVDIPRRLFFHPLDLYAGFAAIQLSRYWSLLSSTSLNGAWKRIILRSILCSGDSKQYRHSVANRLGRLRKDG